MFTFDFETAAIAPRPDYPPRPVGVATVDGYLAWGHPTGNTHTAEAAQSLLATRWSDPLLCHNAAFDLAVAVERLGLPLPEGRQVNDTMFLAFLLDPYGDLGLKPLAERYLGIPPTERDAVRQWLQANVKMPTTNRKPTDKQCGALISRAPADVVGPYAVGDCTRTRDLFAKLYPLVVEAGMREAYDRECAILPMLLDNSAQGIPLDHKRLYRDTASYEAELKQVDQALARHLGRINLDSGDELADALESKLGVMLPTTPTGRRSTAKGTLLDALPDCRVKGLLVYRSALEKCLSTYMRPWVAQGVALHANWNQVRNYDDDGARTGRLSSSPNLQNMTNPEKYDEVYTLLRRCKVKGCIELPNLRSYIVPPKGMVLFSRDYSQQEFRLLGHFEDGLIAQAYRDNPDTDMHVFTRDLINEVTHIGIARKPPKTINFGKVYGMGIAKLAASLGVTPEMAATMMNAYDTALPSVRGLMREVSNIGRRGEHITTIGGRRYYSPPAVRDPDTGQVRTFEYKLLNYLIQGSAADQTKEAMRLWWELRLSRATNGTRFLLTVHDQLVGCAPKKEAKKESEVLADCMDLAFKLDVPMKSDPTYGINFGEMK
jgi:DNA polymerase I-like protein with 3'-5' exonuclease and polymerase domains